MTDRSRTISFPELAKMLEVIPAQLKGPDQEELCRQMTLVVVPDNIPGGDKEAVHEHCQEVVQQMHDCMHNSPRVGGLLALNCLVMLDIMLRTSVPGERDRMQLYASLMGLASKIGAMQSSGVTSGRMH